MALRVRNRSAFQVADKVAVNPGNVRQINRKVSFFCTKGTSGGGDAYPLELTSQLRLHFVRNPPGHLSNLINVLNLAVQHSPLAMLFLFNRQNFQPFVHNAARNANNAAGSDVQSENQLRILMLQFLGHCFHLWFVVHSFS